MGLRTDDPLSVRMAHLVMALLNQNVGTPRRELALSYSSIFGSSQRAYRFFDHAVAKGSAGLSPSLFLSALPNMPAGYLSMFLGSRRGMAVRWGGSPLTSAISWLRSGRESHVLAIAGDCISDQAVDAMAKSGYREHHPILTEGVAALLLTAAPENATPPAEILGFATSKSANLEEIRSRTIDETRAVCTMTDAICDACVRRHDIDFIALCGSSRDSADVQAIKKLGLGGRRFLSPKDSIGETLSASGLASIVYVLGLHLLNPSTIMLNDLQLTGEFSTTVIRLCN